MHKAKWRSVSTELFPDTQDDHPILRKEVGAAVQALKKGKSAGVDSIMMMMMTCVQSN